MYTITTILIIAVINIKKLTSIPITSIFLLSYNIKVAFSFYWFKDLSVWADQLSAMSFLIVFLVSSMGIKSSVSASLKVNKSLYTGAIYLLIISCFLYILPVFFFDESTPILEAIFGDHRVAHETRIMITKESFAKYLLDILGKICLPVPIFIFGLSYSSSNLKQKLRILFLLLVTAFISVIYFQKAMPFSILGVFLFGALLSKGLSKKMTISITGIGFLILYLLSSLFVEDSTDTIIKFNDLLYRRLGQVPALVYQAYIDYGQEFPPLFLEYNFIINKSSSSPALPMIIYSYMSYGESELGWANGLFIGDTYVNFGTYGVILTSFFIGWLIRLGNKLSKKETINIFSLLAILSISLIAFYLPGNAFYGYTIFLLMIIFLSLYIAIKYVKR